MKTNRRGDKEADTQKQVIQLTWSGNGMLAWSRRSLIYVLIEPNYAENKIIENDSNACNKFVRFKNFQFIH